MVCSPGVERREGYGWGKLCIRVHADAGWGVGGGGKKVKENTGHGGWGIKGEWE